ncbi:hypothetical protein P280DRAFT_529932 [Massarina eburnea CBS 473.64]|uniref:Uncharacterized protein n=1 Tax=Massarina eburnea CBS 473.64 TaxID=1395130 RepID=A0A6A6RQF7_9PLEO|nr:hypothetical protein P280DRAFT_529932 [Massarina eburnea CBS 473.64]
MPYNLDFTLPSTAPAEYLWRDGPELLTTALYTLVPLSDDELREVARKCESLCENDDEGEVVRPAPESRFVSQPLRAVYDTHIKLGVRGEFDPIYFIVVVHKNWKERGVLLVTLMTDDEPPLIDSFFCKPEDSGITVQNLQIGNSDWEESRESWEIAAVDVEQEVESNADDKDDVEFPTDAEEGQSDDEGPQYPPKKPAYAYLIPIYILSSVDANVVISGLESHNHPMSEPLISRIHSQASLTPKPQQNIDIKTLAKPDPQVTEDLIAQACTLHPVRCRANKWLNKTYLLVCDNTNYSQEGLILVKLAWDGVTKGRSKDELRKTGKTASREARRIPGTSVDGIRYGYLMIADDTAVFSRTHSAFCIFQLNTDMPHHGVNVVDSQHSDRKANDEYFEVMADVELHRSSEPENIKMEWTLKEAINRFPWVCYSNRFEPLFNRQYFIFVDHEVVVEKGVILVRYDWDGNIKKSEGELWDSGKLGLVRTMRIPAKVAMSKILRAVADGSEGWSWQSYTE